MYALKFRIEFACYGRCIFGIATFLCITKFFGIYDRKKKYDKNNEGENTSKNNRSINA